MSSDSWNPRNSPQNLYPQSGGSVPPQPPADPYGQNDGYYGPTPQFGQYSSGPQYAVGPRADPPKSNRKWWIVGGVGCGGLTILAIIAVIAIIAIIALNGGKSTPVNELTRNQCFNVEGEPAYAAEVQVIECSEEHYGQVYATAKLTGPDVDALETEAKAACETAIAGNVDPAATFSYSYAYYWPNDVQWREGQRTAVCYIFPTSGSTSSEDMVI